MKVLITAGPTREPIDAVRYIGNRSSGVLGAALAEAALRAWHEVTLVLGPVAVAMPQAARRIDVETADQMHEAVLREFPQHDLLIMAAAVADYRPKQVHRDKLARSGALTIECEPTPDIVAAAAAAKRLDLIVYNPVETMSSQAIDAVLLWFDGRSEPLPSLPKPAFADILLKRAAELF